MTVLFSWFYTEHMKHEPEMISIGLVSAWVHSPAKPASIRMLLIHGMGEHSGRHQNTIEFLVGKGIEVVRFDLRGAGQSGGERQWISSWEDYVADTTSVFNWICSSLEPLPLYVLGHSMGGAIAVSFAARYASQLRGLILSAPAHQAGESISKLKIAVGRVVAKLAPHLRLPRSLDAGFISRIPEVVQAYENDPLSCHFNTLRQGASVLDAMANLPHHLPALRMPVLILHGSSDQIVKAEGSFDILRALPGPDRILHILPGGYHEPHNDLCREEFFALIGRWIDNQLATQRLEEISPSAPAVGRAKASGRRTKRLAKEAE
jgi:alpha-beta hydrolase superfamily lysophospholipase